MTETMGFKKEQPHSGLYYCPVCRELLHKQGIFLPRGAGRLYACDDECRNVWEKLSERRQRAIADAVRIKGWAALAEFNINSTGDRNA